MKDILLHVLSGIVDDPSSIEILEDDTDGNVVFTLKVPQDQMGRVIGKGGKTINSIKNILKISAIKEKKRVEINVMEKT